MEIDNLSEKISKLEEYGKKYPEINKLITQANESELVMKDLIDNIKSYEYYLENEELDSKIEEIINRVLERYNYQIGEEFGKIGKIYKEIEKTIKKLNLEF